MMKLERMGSDSHVDSWDNNFFFKKIKMLSIDVNPEAKDIYGHIF